MTISTRENNKFIYRIAGFLAYSNIIIALEAFSIAFITIILMDFNLKPKALFIPFTSFFLIYNMDRYLGADEDEENMPRRTRFVRKYGAFFFYSSILMYLISLILAVDTGLTAFSLTLFPVLLSILYSPLNLKKYIFVGNMIVGIAWGSVPLFIGSYYGGILAPEIIFLSFFFTISWFRNATIFDIKDVKGDLIEGVRTIPNTYGIANTKFIAFLINIGLMITWLILILIGPLSYEFLVLISFHLYVLGYAQLLNNEKGEYYYSVIIDGECKALALFVALAAFVGLI